MLDEFPNGVKHRLEENSGRRSNQSRNSGRNSDESVRSTGRKSGDNNSRKPRSSTHRKSVEKQSSESATSDAQLAQITDILLSRLISTLSDSTLGNPALLLQTLLGFSPEDYNDLLAALSESHLSYVDIISAYLHNIRVMSEDSGSTSAALSGTLTRSLIDQYNNLLSQAVKSPQSLARASLAGDSDGRANLTDLLQKTGGGGGGNEGTRPERRSFDNSLPKGPAGLGFGRRHSADSVKQRQNFLQNSGLTEPHSKSTNLTENGVQDFAKLLNMSKTNGGTIPATTGSAEVGNFGGISPEQLTTVLLQNPGILSNGFGATGPMATTTGSQFGMSPPPTLPYHLNPTNPVPANGVLGPNPAPFGIPGPPVATTMQPWVAPSTVPVQQQVPVNNRALWQQGSNPGEYHLGLGGWGAGLETVHENLNSPAFQIFAEQANGVSIPPPPQQQQ